jgi:hypothetical protein
VWPQVLEQWYVVRFRVFCATLTWDFTVGSLAEVPNINVQATRGSPLRDGVSFNVPPSVELQGGHCASVHTIVTDVYGVGANANVATTHALQLPGRTVSDSSASSGGSSKSRKSSKSKSSRKETPLVKDEDKIVIVLLDDNDKDKVKGTTPEKKKVVAPDDDATWHGWVVLVPCLFTAPQLTPLTQPRAPSLHPLNEQALATSLGTQLALARPTR